jgi:hypothetical protein
MIVPEKISTNTRIFKIINFDNDMILCNLQHIKIKDLEQIKTLHHLWNGVFKPFAKIDLKEMILNK